MINKSSIRCFRCIIMLYILRLRKLKSQFYFLLNLVNCDSLRNRKWNRKKINEKKIFKQCKTTFKVKFNDISQLKDVAYKLESQKKNKT